jgi:hypothetical protein
MPHKARIAAASAVASAAVVVALAAVTGGGSSPLTVACAAGAVTAIAVQLSLLISKRRARRAFAACRVLAADALGGDRDAARVVIDLIACAVRRNPGRGSVAAVLLLPQRGLAQGCASDRLPVWAEILVSDWREGVDDHQIAAARFAAGAHRIVDVLWATTRPRLQLRAAPGEAEELLRTVGELFDISAGASSDDIAAADIAATLAADGWDRPLEELHDAAYALV